MASARELEKKHKETGVHHERSMSRTRHRGDQAMPHLFSTLNWIWVEIVGEIPGTSVDIDGKNFLNAFPGPEFGGSRPIDWSQNKRSSKNNSALAVGGLVGSRSSMALGSLPQSSFYHGIRSVRRPTPVYKLYFQYGSLKETAAQRRAMGLLDRPLSGRAHLAWC
jgi:hypothetical protein